jgi:YHS domain-containing protein
MVRFVLYAVLLILFARAAARLWRGLSDGTAGRPPHGDVAQHSVQMVRDPVCGTFVLPDRSVTLSIGRQQFYFCSATCRDKYRARPA